MSDVVSPILQWLNANPHLAGLVTFTISAGESVAIIGTIVPGTIMMTALGALAGAGIIPLWSTIIWAILGAILGDGISYWIGYYFKDRLERIWPFRSHPGLLRVGEVFFHKHGGKSVFIGRFVGPVRALVPVVAGMLGMRPLHFTIANILSAIGWAPIYMLPGIALGAASMELPPDIAIHVILVMLFVGLFILLCIWFIYKLLYLIHNQITQWQNRLWQWLKNSRLFSPLTILLKHPDPQQEHGQLALAIYLVLLFILFIIFTGYIITHPANTITINEILVHLFRGIRRDDVDGIMVNITLLGQKQVILAVFALTSAWLFCKKQWRCATHLLGLSIVTAGSIFTIKHLVQSLRPWGTVNPIETFSFPSGHTTLATTLYIGMAYLVATQFSKRRGLIYFPAILTAFLVGLSRLYLGQHWFTDVMGAWLWSAILLLVFIISYERQPHADLMKTRMLSAFFASLILCFSTYHYFYFDKIKADTALVDWPVTEIQMQDWWQAGSQLPSYRTSLFGFPSSPLNLEWVGNIESIHATLIAEGWEKPPARDLVSTLHRIADVQSTEYLPLVSPQYLDKKPVIILTRQIDLSGKRLLEIRLWDANQLIKTSHENLWVGYVAVVPRAYSWLNRKNRITVEISPALVFPLKNKAHAWEWKTAIVERKKHSHHVAQTILLIRQKPTIPTTAPRPSKKARPHRK